MCSRSAASPLPRVRPGASDVLPQCSVGVFLWPLQVFAQLLQMSAYQRSFGRLHRLINVCCHRRFDWYVVPLLMQSYRWLFTFSRYVHSVCGRSPCQRSNIHILTTVTQAGTRVRSALSLYAPHFIIACSPCYKYIYTAGSSIYSCLPCICWLPSRECHVLLSSEEPRRPRLLVVSGAIFSEISFSPTNCIATQSW